MLRLFTQQGLELNAKTSAVNGKILRCNVYNVHHLYYFSST